MSFLKQFWMILFLALVSASCATTSSSPQAELPYLAGSDLPEGETTFFLRGVKADPFLVIDWERGQALPVAIVNLFEPDIKVDVSLRYDRSFDQVAFDSYLDSAVAPEFRTVVEGTLVLPDDAQSGVHRLHFEARGGSYQRSVEVWVRVPGLPVPCEHFGLVVEGLQEFESGSFSVDGVRQGNVQATRRGSALIEILVLSGETGSVEVEVVGTDSGPLETLEVPVEPGTCNGLLAELYDDD